MITFKSPACTYVDGNFHNEWAIPSPGSAVLQLTYLSAPRSQDTRDQFQRLVGIRRLV